MKKKKSTRCEKQWEFVVLVTGVFLVKSLLIVKKKNIVVKKKKKSISIPELKVMPVKEIN